jgi:hypothetical protein
MKNRYTIIETTGCTAFGFSINSRELSEISNEEQDKILDYLFLKVKEGIADNTILFNQVVQLFQPDDWEHSTDVCDQCGDSVSTTIWKI